MATFYAQLRAPSSGPPRAPRGPRRRLPRSPRVSPRQPRGRPARRLSTPARRGPIICSRVRTVARVRGSRRTDRPGPPRASPRQRRAPARVLRLVDRHRRHRRAVHRDGAEPAHERHPRAHDGRAGMDSLRVHHRRHHRHAALRRPRLRHRRAGGPTRRPAAHSRGHGDLLGSPVRHRLRRGAVAVLAPPRPGPGPGQRDGRQPGRQRDHFEVVRRPPRLGDLDGGARRVELELRRHPGRGLRRRRLRLARRLDRDGRRDLGPRARRPHHDPPARGPRPAPRWPPSRRRGQRFGPSRTRPSTGRHDQLADARRGGSHARAVAAHPGVRAGADGDDGPVRPPHPVLRRCGIHPRRGALLLQPPGPLLAHREVRVGRGDAAPPREVARRHLVHDRGHGDARAGLHREQSAVAGGRRVRGPLGPRDGWDDPPLRVRLGVLLRPEAHRGGARPRPAVHGHADRGRSPVRLRGVRPHRLLQPRDGDLRRPLVRGCAPHPAGAPTPAAHPAHGPAGPAPAHPARGRLGDPRCDGLSAGVHGRHSRGRPDAHPACCCRGERAGGLGGPRYGRPAGRWRCVRRPRAAAPPATPRPLLHG